MDTYAIQWPSGENSGCVRLKRDSRNNFGLRSPSMERTQIPLVAPAVPGRCIKAITLDAEAHDDTVWEESLVARRSAFALPSALIA